MSHNVKRLPVRLRELAAKVITITGSCALMNVLAGGCSAAQSADQQGAVSSAPASPLQAP